MADGDTPIQLDPSLGNYPVTGQPSTGQQISLTNFPNLQQYLTRPAQPSTGQVPQPGTGQVPQTTGKPGQIGPDTDETVDRTGVADFFRKRGDNPITSSDDPRLTTVKVGNQQWRVHQEAAPYFQGFLSELAQAGAPVRSDGGWNYRQKVGAKGLSEHAYGGAIDVNQNGRNEVTPGFQKWIATNPGVLQATEQHWHIYGGERFGDLGHFEWGGVPGVPSGGDGQGQQQAGNQAQAPPIQQLMQSPGNPQLIDLSRYLQH